MVIEQIEIKDTKKIQLNQNIFCNGSITVSQLESVKTWKRVNNDIPRLPHLSGSASLKSILPIDPNTYIITKRSKLTKKTFLTEASNDSIIFFNSGITDINLNTLNMRRRRKTKKLELFGIGISEIKTMEVSNKFHASLKKFFLFLSPIKRIRISITKNNVII